MSNEARDSTPRELIDEKIRKLMLALEDNLQRSLCIREQLLAPMPAAITDGRPQRTGWLGALQDPIDLCATYASDCNEQLMAVERALVSTAAGV